MATPAEELEEANQQIENVEVQSEELNSSYQQALGELVAVDSEVDRYELEISEAGQRQDEVKAEIEQGEELLNELQGKLDTQLAAFEQRLRTTYKKDEIGYLDVMLGADDFSDFLTRMDMVAHIAAEDQQVMASIVESKRTVEEKMAELAQSQEELTALIAELSSAQEGLRSAQIQQQNFVAALESEMQAHQEELEQLQAEAAAIETKMNEMQSEAYEDEGFVAPPAGGTSFEATATAYCLQGRTATGMPAGRGVIAVDPRVIPLGSQVHVSGYGDAIAADTGGAIIGNRIDVWLPCGEAVSWGVRSVTVTVY